MCKDELLLNLRATKRYWVREKERADLNANFAHEDLMDWEDRSDRAYQAGLEVTEVIKEVQKN